MLIRVPECWALSSRPRQTEQWVIHSDKQWTPVITNHQHKHIAGCEFIKHPNWRSTCLTNAQMTPPEVSPFMSSPICSTLTCSTPFSWSGPREGGTGVDGHWATSRVWLQHPQQPEQSAGPAAKNSTASRGHQDWSSTATRAEVTAAVLLWLTDGVEPGNVEDPIVALHEEGVSVLAISTGHSNYQMVRRVDV